MQHVLSIESTGEIQTDTEPSLAMATILVRLYDNELDAIASIRLEIPFSYRSGETFRSAEETVMEATRRYLSEAASTTMRYSLDQLRMTKVRREGTDFDFEE